MVTTSYVQDLGYWPLKKYIGESYTDVRPSIVSKHRPSLPIHQSSARYSSLEMKEKSPFTFKLLEMTKEAKTREATKIKYMTSYIGKGCNSL